MKSEIETMTNHNLSYAVKDLKAAFSARSSLHNNRASAIFPLRLREGTDLHILFLNYWTLKNGIPLEKLSANLRIYDNAGTLTHLSSILRFEDHNQISIRQVLSEQAGLSGDVVFDGSVHVEILSTSNLSFNFPAVIGAFQSGTLFSAVHSAGRLKNAEEVQSTVYTEESNWTCKFSEGITPFFHYFQGSCRAKEGLITVILRDRNGQPRLSKDVRVDHIPPFGSEIFLVKDVFLSAEFNQGDFVSVRLEHNSIFPRMVVGNLHIKSDFLEVTHSFPIIDRADHCPEGDHLDCQSFLSAYTCTELELGITVFPTNCSGTFDTRVYAQEFGQDKLRAFGGCENFDNEKTAQGFSFTLPESERFRSVHMLGQRVPSRFNASFIYRVRGTKSNYSTDIASGAKSSVYPAKYRHWGNAYIADDYETCVMIRNNSHCLLKTQSAKAKMVLYADGFLHEANFQIGAESSTSVSVSALVRNVVNSSNLMRSGQFISWILETDVPSCETFWVAYRLRDGAVFGDHGF